MKPGARAVAYWARHPWYEAPYWGCPRAKVYPNGHRIIESCCWDARLADWAGATVRAKRSFDDSALVNERGV